MSLALAYNGRCDQAIEQLRPLRSLTPRVGVAGVIAGQCYAAREMWREALAEFQWAMETQGGARTALSFYAYVLARAGNVDSAAAILSDLLSGARYSHGAFGIATVYAGLGDYDRALRGSKSIEENTVRPYLMGPMFDHVRRDARFARIRDRLGL
jgi:predicted Zn-dependent protease